MALLRTLKACVSGGSEVTVLGAILLNVPFVSSLAKLLNKEIHIFIIQIF